MHKPRANYEYWKVKISGINPRAIHAAWHTHTFLIKVPHNTPIGKINPFARKQLKKTKKYLYKPKLAYKELTEEQYLTLRADFSYCLRRMDKHGHVRKEERTEKEIEEINKLNWDKLPQGRKLND